MSRHTFDQALAFLVGKAREIGGALDPESMAELNDEIDECAEAIRKAARPAPPGPRERPLPKRYQRGTVVCGYCQRIGHNRLGCADRKQDELEAAKKKEAELLEAYEKGLP